MYLVMGLGRNVHFSQRMSNVIMMMSDPATPNTMLLVSLLKIFKAKVNIFIIFNKKSPNYFIVLKLIDFLEDVG